MSSGLSPVDVAASVNVHDLHGAGVFDHAENHPVVTAASRAQAGEHATEGLPTRCGWSARGPKMNSASMLGRVTL